MRKLVELGEQLLSVEDDVVIVLKQRHWTIEDINRNLALLEEILAEYGRVFVISDLSQNGDMPATARQRIVAWMRTHSINALVLVRPNLLVRTIGVLTLRAASYFNPNTPPLSVCDTLDEARAIVDNARQRLVNQNNIPRRP
jgi:hypothetical protein